MATVLVVDDAADIRLLLRAVLTRAGFEVLEAASGAEALKALAEGIEPDVVVLDVQMPGMTGWDTLEAMRRRAGVEKTAVIVCTVKSPRSDARRAWELGGDGYLTKPFSIHAVVEEVVTVAARSPDQRLAVRATMLAGRHQQDEGADPQTGNAWTSRP